MNNKNKNKEFWDFLFYFWRRWDIKYSVHNAHRIR